MPHHARSLVGAMILALVLVTPAAADCISACIAGKDCSLNYSGACSSALSDCSQQCMAENQGPAYGAIAYDSVSGAFGFAYQFPSENAAADFALGNCAENGDSCELITTFANACAALAAGEIAGEPRSFTVIADSRAKAESRALASCTEDGSNGCEIQVWSCSNW